MEVSPRPPKKTEKRTKVQGKMAGFVNGLITKITGKKEPENQKTTAARTTGTPKAEQPKQIRVPNHAVPKAQLDSAPLDQLFGEPVQPGHNTEPSTNLHNPLKEKEGEEKIEVLVEDDDPVIETIIIDDPMEHRPRSAARDRPA